MLNIIKEKLLEKIAENAGARLWKRFVTCGSASAGVLNIILLIRLIRLDHQGLRTSPNLQIKSPPPRSHLELYYPPVDTYRGQEATERSKRRR